MKKIIFKIWKFPHLSETFILNQIITAINSGFEVQILIGELLNIEESKQQILFKKYNIEEKIIIENYNAPKNKIVRIFKWLSLLAINIFQLKYIFRFHKKHSKFRVNLLYQFQFYKQFRNSDIFHIQYGTNKNPVDILKKIDFLNASIVVSFHGHDAFFPINGYIPNNGYYNDLFSVSNKIVANTPYLAEVILELGCPKDKISIIPIHVDTDFFYPPKKRLLDYNKIKLITVGRLSKVKGQIYAFKAIKKLKQVGYNIVLKVVGEGDERVNLEQYVKDNNLQESIILVGSKSQTEVRQLLWDSDIFLFPSVSKHFGKSTETQGLATIEAEACGLPVVVFDSGGVKYTLENKVTGFICKEYDYECMFNKIKLLIDNPIMLNDMKSETVKFVHSYYSKNLIDISWKSLYNNLSNGK